jgi:hypothetical protein
LVRLDKEDELLLLPAAKIELLDYVTDLFESMMILMANGSGVGDDQESSAFKENDFISIADPTKVVKM